MGRHTLSMLGLCGAALALSLQAVAAQQEFSPANRQRGKAAVEYRDSDVHIVAAYYYSQRNHESHWLMIEAAMSTNDPETIARDVTGLVGQLLENGMAVELGQAEGQDARS